MSAKKYGLAGDSSGVIDKACTFVEYARLANGEMEEIEDLQDIDAARLVQETRSVERSGRPEAAAEIAGMAFQVYAMRATDDNTKEGVRELLTVHFPPRTEEVYSAISRVAEARDTWDKTRRLRNSDDATVAEYFTALAVVSARNVLEVFEGDSLTKEIVLESNTAGGKVTTVAEEISGVVDHTIDPVVIGLKRVQEVNPSLARAFSDAVRAVEKRLSEQPEDEKRLDTRKPMVHQSPGVH